MKVDGRALRRRFTTASTYDLCLWLIRGGVPMRLARRLADLPPRERWPAIRAALADLFPIDPLWGVND